MILPDVNLLLHAFDSRSSLNGAARTWWEEAINSHQMIGLPWAVSLGFLRISTNRRIFEQPLSVLEASGQVRAWLNRKHVVVINPGERHRDLLLGFLEMAGTAGNLTTDAHLAALAIEYQCELQSTDSDFSRFPGLRWRNPLVG